MVTVDATRAEGGRAVLRKKLDVRFHGTSCWKDSACPRRRVQAAAFYGCVSR